MTGGAGSADGTLVVGGGIGGLATALAIGQSGRKVHLLEQAAEFVEIGAGLQVGPNATRMLDRLGVLDRVMDVAVTPGRAVMRDAINGELITTLDFGARFRERYGYPYIVLHRGDLLTILFDACTDLGAVTVENNKTVSGVWSDDDEAGVRCADGSEYRADLLVGADGLHSRVRKLIHVSPPRNSGYVAYRGVVPVSEVESEIDVDDVVLWIGPGMHLMQYPVRSYEVYNQVAVFRSERFTSGAEPYGTPDELREHFGQACDAVQRHVSRIGTDRRWPIFDRDPLDTWVRGRAVLLGDAAHPMLQYLGQGACQALEDAYILGRVIAAKPADIPAALTSYERLRLARTTRCQLSARPWGDVWHTGDPAMLGLRNRVLGSHRPDDYTELDWLYLDQAS